MAEVAELGLFIDKKAGEDGEISCLEGLGFPDELSRIGDDPRSDQEPCHAGVAYSRGKQVELKTRGGVPCVCPTVDLHYPSGGFSVIELDLLEELVDDAPLPLVPHTYTHYGNKIRFAFVSGSHDSRVNSGAGVIAALHFNDVVGRRFPLPGSGYLNEPCLFAQGGQVLGSQVP